MNYSGYQELKDFVENNEKPTFSRFANQHKGDIVRWSTQLSFQTASALYGIWHERFQQVVNAMPQPKSWKAKFNNILRNSLVTKCQRRRELVEIYQEAGIEVLTAAAGAATNEAIRQFELIQNAPNSSSIAHNGSSSAQSRSPESQSGLSVSTTEDLFQQLFHYANKKFLGTLTVSEKAMLSSIPTSEDNTCQRMAKHIVKLLKKGKLTSYEEEENIT